LGILEDIETKRRYTLGPRCLVGRHASCDLCFSDPRVSGEHAIVRWVDERWEVKDLGSRNGTFVNGRRLAAGERMTLWRGEAVTLGGSTVGFVLADAAAPGPTARHGTTGEVRVATDQVLVLPSEERPLVTVFEDAFGRWVAEREDGAVPVRDHDLVLVDGEPWGARAAGGAADDVGRERGADARDDRASVLGEPGRGARRRGHRRRSERDPPAGADVSLFAPDARAHPEEGRGERRGGSGLADREKLCRMLAIDQLKLNVDICRRGSSLASSACTGRGPHRAALGFGADPHRD
jgi:hypothetical protein